RPSLFPYTTLFRSLYPLAFVLFFGAFLVALATRSEADITLLGPVASAPFTRDADGRVVNQVRLRIANRTATAKRYTIAYLDEPGAQLIAPENPLPVAPGETVTTSVFVMQSETRFAAGERLVRFRVTDGADFTREFAWRLPGPSPSAAAPEGPQ